MSLPISAAFSHQLGKNGAPSTSEFKMSQKNGHLGEIYMKAPLKCILVKNMGFWVRSRFCKMQTHTCGLRGIGQSSEENVRVSYWDWEGCIRASNIHWKKYLWVQTRWIIEFWRAEGWILKQLVQKMVFNIFVEVNRWSFATNMGYSFSVYIKTIHQNLHEKA